MLRKSLKHDDISNFFDNTNIFQREFGDFVEYKQPFRIYKLKKCLFIHRTSFYQKRTFVHCFVFRSRRAKECRFQSQKIAPIRGQPAWIVDMHALTTGLTINFSNLKNSSIRYQVFTSNDQINVSSKLIEPLLDQRL